MTPRDYRILAEIRHQVRRFLAFSEAAAKAVGLEPRQHQLLLAIKGFPKDSRPSVGALAEQLQLRHHSTVELMDRLVRRGLARRRRSPSDRRAVLGAITPSGRQLLRKLSLRHWEELRRRGPRLVRALAAVLGPVPRLKERIRTYAGESFGPSPHPPRRRD